MVKQAILNKTIIHLEGNISAYMKAEFFINDIPVELLGDGQTFLNSPITAHLIKGENQLRIEVRDLETPSNQCTARVVEYEDGMLSSDPSAKVHSEISFDTSEKNVGVVTFNITDTQGPWSWECAEVIDLSDEKQKEEVLDFLDNLHKEFVASNGEYLANLMKHRFEDTNKAYPAFADPNKKEELIDFYNAVKTITPSYKEFDRTKENLRSCAFGKLVQCRDKNDESFLYFTAPNGHVVEEKLFLGKLDGKFHILR